MYAVATSLLLATVAAALRGEEDSPFEPAFIHFSDDGTSILAIDAQKPWEDAKSYADRVVTLLTEKEMTEAKDPIFICHVFLGGLRPALLDAVFKLNVNAYELRFQQVLDYVLFLENNSDDPAMKVLYLGGARPLKWYQVVKPNKPSFQEGLVYFGKPNETVDAYYHREWIKAETKILYRH